jgi:hypothetical protein
VLALKGIAIVIFLRPLPSAGTMARMDKKPRDDRQAITGPLWVRFIGTSSLLVFVILPVLVLAAVGIVVYLTIDTIRRVRWEVRKI